MHELFKELKHYHVYINGVTINFPQLIIDKFGVVQIISDLQQLMIWVQCNALNLPYSKAH
jgi:hypothetical protein